MHHLYIFMHFTSTWTMQWIFSPSSSSLSSFFQFLLLLIFFFLTFVMCKIVFRRIVKKLYNILWIVFVSPRRRHSRSDHNVETRVLKKKKKRRLKTRRIVSFTYNLQSSSIFLQKFEDSRSLSTRVHSRRNANIIHIIIL